ncbi:MAG: DUF262 domain-containing protein [Burkholderiales bacterium]|nr:DUF262 domain-containing protein [Burkholderiales bacterium]
MQITSTAYTVADYCAAMERHEIMVNKDYQRSDQVWPPVARSFLIETVMLGYPIPKIYLSQVTDIKSRKTTKEIVDGQQRSQAIFDFYSNRFALDRSTAIEGGARRTYEELSDELKSHFLSYQLSVDLFVGATRDQIIETFRRMNSYTVPLNFEEQRHAKFQGAFKWFIYNLTKTYSETLIQIGAFGEKNIVRMNDAKLATEFCHAVLHGITTTNKQALDKLYETRDKDFPEQPDLQRRFDEAMARLMDFTEIHNGALMKPYLLYSLLLAITQAQRPLDGLRRRFNPPAGLVIDRAIAVANLSRMAEAIESEEPPAELSGIHRGEHLKDEYQGTTRKESFVARKGASSRADMNASCARSLQALADGRRPAWKAAAIGGRELWFAGLRTRQAGRIRCH